MMETACNKQAKMICTYLFNMTYSSFYGGGGTFERRHD